MINERSADMAQTEEIRIISPKTLFALLLPLVEQGESVVIPVKGDSMYPIIRDGIDRVRLIKLDEPKIGDIVLAKVNEETYFLHRIVRRIGDSYILKGDNKTVTDGIFTREDLLAVADRVYRGTHEIDPYSCIVKLRFGVYSKLLHIIGRFRAK